MLDPAARQRLARLLHAHGLGPDPQVLYLIYGLASGTDRARLLIDAAPDLLDEAEQYQLITYDLDLDTGTPTKVQLSPVVMYSLGLARDLPEHGQAATHEPQITEDR
jgi:hypothetical protein